MGAGNENRKVKGTVVVNYICLVIMNVCYYFAWAYEDLPHSVDAIGLGALAIVGATFIRGYWKTGLWRLTHTTADRLDERQLQVTHHALSRSYGWFAVVCLVIMMAHALIYRLVPGLEFAISVPLVASLIYLAHTLPGTFLAWTENELPGPA